jgi:hypothetical protein
MPTRINLHEPTDQWLARINAIPPPPPPPLHIRIISRVIKLFKKSPKKSPKNSETPKICQEQKWEQEQGQEERMYHSEESMSFHSEREDEDEW